MDHLAHRLDHGPWVVGLEDIAPHVHPGRAFLDRVVTHGQGVFFRDLLAAGHDDGHRAARGDGVEAVGDVVGLDVMGPELGTNAAGEPEIPGVALHVLAHRGHRQDRDPVAHAGVHQLRHVMHGLGLVLATDKDLHRQSRDVEPHRLLHAHRDLLVGELLEDTWPAAGPQDDSPVIGGRHRGPQDAAGQHQGIGKGGDGHDVEVDALQAGGRPLEIPVVHGQHHGAAALGVEDPRQPVLDPPIQ